MKSNFIRTVQSLSWQRVELKRSIHTYETVLSVLNRIQRCSILTNTIPNSVTTKSIQDELFSIYSELNASKQESEMLIRELSQALHPIGYSVSIADVGSGFLMNSRPSPTSRVNSPVSRPLVKRLPSLLRRIPSTPMTPRPCRSRSLPPTPICPCQTNLFSLRPTRMTSFRIRTQPTR